MVTIRELVTILRDIVRSDELPLGQVRAFQEAVWETPETDDDASAWDLLIDLATDMEYYVPDPELRREHPSYFGDDRLIEEIQATLEKLEQAEESLRES